MKINPWALLFVGLAGTAVIYFALHKSVADGSDGGDGLITEPNFQAIGTDNRVPIGESYVMVAGVKYMVDKVASTEVYVLLKDSTGVQGQSFIPVSVIDQYMSPNGTWVAA